MERIKNIVEYEAIMYELGNFSFKRNSISYQYLIEAIYLVTENRNAIKDFKKCIYPCIAEKYGTKPENVQWCISKLLKVMYLNTDFRIIENYFGVRDGENPSAKAFIIHVSYKIIKKIMGENIETTSNLQFLL